MKVLHLLASPVFSGPAESVLELARAQRALGVDVAVALDRKRSGLGSEEPSLPRFQEAGLLDDGGLALSTHSSPLEMARDVLRLRSRPLDVVHAHFSHDHWIARLGRPAAATLVRSIHAPRSLTWSTPRADVFTVPSAELLPRVSPALVLPPLLPAHFAPPTDRDALRTELGWAGSPLVGMVSTFQPSRRHPLALTAFAQLIQRRPQARLLLVGDGILEGELRAQAAALGLTASVTFAGYQKGLAFVRALQCLDEVWILGLGNDWSGRTAAQARRCGVRVVAVRQGALPDWADAVLPAETAQALVEASLLGHRVEGPVPSAETVARQVLSLYLGVRA